MARIEDIERRLLNWARWKCGPGVGGLGFSAVNLLGQEYSTRVREAVIPTSDCEAEETDRAVKTLPQELQQALVVVYVQGGGRAQKARKLGCTEATVDARVWRAHALLQSQLAAMAAAARDQRRRVEELQRAARN
jgi:DNA-directed RNA polymerase specialized sigma24 family protein